MENFKIYSLSAKFEFTEPKQLVKLVRKEEMKRLQLKKYDRNIKN
jgi:hypothetical protein